MLFFWLESSNELCLYHYNKNGVLIYNWLQLWPDEPNVWQDGASGFEEMKGIPKAFSVPEQDVLMEID